MQWVIAVFAVLLASVSGVRAQDWALDSALLTHNVAQTYTGIVATRGNVPVATVANNRYGMYRSYHKATDTISSLQVVWPNWYLDTVTLAETASGFPETISASVEYPAGTFTRITFSSANSGTVASNGKLVSDSVSVSIPQGAFFWIRTYVDSGSGGGVIAGTTIQCANGEGSEFSNTSLTDKTMSGTVTCNSNFTNYTPAAIIGMTRRPSVLLVGDSRVWGVGDTVDASGDVGDLGRSVGAAPFGYINTAKSGQRTSVFIASHAHNVNDLAPYVSHVISELGANDIVGLNSSAATIEANLATIWGYYTGKTVYQTTLEPSTNSTDSWATLANQTAVTNETTSGNGTREQVNNWCRSIPSGIAGCFDTSDQVESSRNSGKWIVNGTANWATADGAHATQVGYLKIQNSGAVDTKLIKRF